MRTIARLLGVLLAALAGAALGDLLRQRLLGEAGRVIRRSPQGNWSFHVPPRAVLPAVWAGFRAEQRSLLIAAGTALLATFTAGEGLEGLAKRFLG